MNPQKMMTTPKHRPSHPIKSLFYMLFLSLWLIPVLASDVDREKQWCAQITDSLVNGEAVTLKAGNTPFLGIYTMAGKVDAGRAAIIVHGMGAHPDWPDVIHPLRSELPDHGWSTLSVQMPILANNAGVKDYAPLFDEATPRLQAAIAYLRAHGNKTIVIIAHSLGASMAAHFIANNPAAGVNGLVLISPGIIKADAKMNSLPALEKITLPILDLYGSRDRDNVRTTVAARARAARKAGNHDYRQIEIEGADHFYTGVEDELVRRVYGWLKSHYEKTTGK